MNLSLICWLVHIPVGNFTPSSKKKKSLFKSNLFTYFSIWRLLDAKSLWFFCPGDSGTHLAGGILKIWGAISLVHTLRSKLGVKDSLLIVRHYTGDEIYGISVSKLFTLCFGMLSVALYAGFIQLISGFTSEGIDLSVGV